MSREQFHSVVYLTRRKCNVNLIFEISDRDKLLSPLNNLFHTMHECRWLVTMQFRLKIGSQRLNNKPLFSFLYFLHSYYLLIVKYNFVCMHVRKSKRKLAVEKEASRIISWLSQNHRITVHDDGLFIPITLFCSRFFLPNWMLKKSTKKDKL